MYYSVQLATSMVLASLALDDLRFRRLPNRWVSCVAGLYVLSAMLVHASVASFAQHVGLAATVFVLAALLYRFGWIGGGDVKLAAAVFLWSGPALAAPILFIVSSCGLVLGVAVFAIGSLARFTARVKATSALPPTRRTTTSVPYGLALALGGAAAVWAPSLILFTSTSTSIR